MEHLVAASCILASGGALNVSTSLVDDEGVDLVFQRRGESGTVAVQVKSRSTDTTEVQRDRFVAEVRSQTFRPRPDLFMLFVVIDRPKAAIGKAWLVPSEQFDERATLTGKGRRRFAASLKPDTQDKWSGYRMEFPELPGAILRVLADSNKQD